MLGHPATEVCEVDVCEAAATTLTEQAFLCDRHLADTDALSRRLPYGWAVVRDGRWMAVSAVIAPRKDLREVGKSLD